MIISIYTHQSYPTSVSVASRKDIDALKKSEWAFNWQDELKSERAIYKLRLRGAEEILGVMSISEQDGILRVHNLERRGFKNKEKKFDGIGQSLFAYACKLSFELGFSGYVIFDVKSKEFEYFEKTLGAVRVGRNHYMMIDNAAAIELMHTWL
jgi:hypothetical protein